jgi:hypothetical protein
MEIQVPVIPPSVQLSDERKQELIEGFMVIAMRNKRREAMAGFTRGWVAHPDMVATVQAPFKEIYGDGKFPVLNQTENPAGEKWTPLTYTDADAHAFFAQPEKRQMTQQSVRNDISVGIQYILNALTGRGAGLIKPADYFNDPSVPFLMQDRATAEGEAAGERKKVVEEAEYTADDEMDHIKAGERLTRTRFLTTVDGEFRKLHEAPDYLIHDNVKETYLRIATMIFTKFVLAAKDDGIYLSWVADLEEVVQSLTEHGITDHVQAEKLVDRFIRDYKRSRGLSRTTIDNNAIFQVDAAMIDRRTVTPMVDFPNSLAIRKKFPARNVREVIDEMNSRTNNAGRYKWTSKTHAFDIFAQSILRGLISEASQEDSRFTLQPLDFGWEITGSTIAFQQWLTERESRLPDAAMTSHQAPALNKANYARIERDEFTVETLGAMLEYATSHRQKENIRFLTDALRRRQKLDRRAERKNGNGQDLAQIAPKGGIDLNTANGMRWTDNKDGVGVQMNVDPAMVERVRREGVDWLAPDILRMTPIASVWPLVGMQGPPVEVGRLAKA